MVLQQLPAQQLFTIVNAASRMPFNACKALRSQHSLECSHVCCVYHNTYDPGISPGNQCIFGDMYLRSKLSGEPGTHTVLTQYLYKTGIDLSFAS